MNIYCRSRKPFGNPAAQYVEKKGSKMRNGAPERIRTSDPQIRSLELRVINRNHKISYCLFLLENA